MIRTELLQKSVTELSSLLADRQVSSRELTAACLDSITRRDGEIGAYLTICSDAALKAADESDARRASGQPRSAIDGVPAAIKDNLCTSGIRTTCASKMLEHYMPPYDATAVEKLKAAGAVILGKVNLDEFAMGSTCENSALKLTRNPRDLTRVPGGSSGGSAAAVAACEAPFALGSDTGGSIRLPAAFCGCVGLKPTYGRVSRYGLIAFASSLDAVGTLTKNIEDSARLLGVIAGHDPRDATSADRPADDYLTALRSGAAGMRVGLIRQLSGAGLSPAVEKTLGHAAERFRAMGADVGEFDLPALDAALPAYYVLSSAEASSNLARFDGIRYGYRTKNYTDIDSLYKNTRSEGFGPEVKRRILLGTFALSSGYYDAYYKKALAVRKLVADGFARVFENCDVLLAPVAPTVAYKIGEKTSDPLQMYLGDVCTVPVNIAGLPAVSLPCGEDEAGLPVGLQLIGRAFGEADILRAGEALETDLSAGGEEQ